MKNKILAAIVALAMIGVPALAATQIWTNVDAPCGETHFYQMQETQGPWYGDGDGGSWSGKYDANGKTTAYTTEGFDNYGSVHYDSYFDTSNGIYDSERWSNLAATGSTNYGYTYKARSLCAGKTQDITHYEVHLSGYTSTGDMPSMDVTGTAPGYGGNYAGDWSQATTIYNGFNTNENVNWHSFTWTNPQHYSP